MLHKSTIGMLPDPLPFREGPLGLRLILAVLAEFEAVLYADHVRFHSGHPYIDRLPTV